MDHNKSDSNSNNNNNYNNDNKIDNDIIDHNQDNHEIIYEDKSVDIQDRNDVDDVEVADIIILIYQPYMSNK